VCIKIQYHHIEFDVKEQLKDATLKDLEYKFLWKKTKKMQDSRKPFEYGIDERNLLTFRGRTYVPNQVSFKQIFLYEFHCSPYASRPGYHKMFFVIKSRYFWHGMRKDIMIYLAKCLECQ